MFKKNNFGFLVSVCITLTILSSIKPDILSQSKKETIKWPELKFEHITVKDGLPSNEVRCMLQDHLGFIWFGTTAGLVRYDGYELKYFQKDPNNTRSISSNSVNAICEDNDGNLWVGTRNSGLNRFDRVTNSFETFAYNPEDTNSLSSNYIICLYIDSKGRLWVGTYNGLNLFDKDTKYFKKLYYLGKGSKTGKQKLDPYVSEVDISPDVPHFINAISESHLTGNIFIGGLKGLWTVDENKQKILPSDISNNNISIRGFLEIKSGEFFINTSRGLGKFNEIFKSVTIYQPVTINNYVPENELNGGILEMDGLILSGSMSGDLVCFSQQNEEFHIYSNKPGNPQNLSLSSPIGICAILIDHSGVLWVSEGDFGLNKWDRYKTKFNSYRYDEDSTKSMGNNQVMSIIEDKSDNVWIGTYGGGLIKYSRQKKNFIRFINDNNSTNCISDNFVMIISEDKNDSGVLWIGTANGLNKFDIRTEQFTRYIHNPNNINSLSNNYIMHLLSDSNNILWICTYGGGLNKFNTRSEEFIRFWHDPEDSTSIEDNFVWFCYKDKQNTLWVGTAGHSQTRSLCRFYGSNKFKSFSAADKNWDINTNLVFYEDRLSNFWIGDLYTGLFLFDRDDEKYVLHFTQEDGLTYNGIMSILEDNSGNLWISTYNGLSKFDPVRKIFRNYYEEDGLSNNKFFFHSSFKSKTGELFFGGENGFTWFYPEDIKDDPTPPAVVIDKLSLFNRPEEKLEIDGFISEMEEIELPYNHNDLRFDYVGLHYGDPSKNKYKYKLENFDEDWVDAGTQRNAVYTNLDPGEFVFRVIASNHDGMWNEEGKSLRIIINHPYWATWWAYGIYILFAVGLFYAVRKYEVNRLRLKNQVKLDEIVIKEREETDKIKSRFFANISHEFRTPLTLISGPSESIVSESKEEETKKKASIIKRNASRLLDLINQLLDLSKLEAGKLQLKASPGNIVSFVKGITMSFESIAERKDITLRVTSDREEIEVYFDRDMMAKILSNLLSNAFKFTPDGGDITVSVSNAEPALPAGRLVSASSEGYRIPNQVRDDNIVEISVKDSGIGISEEELPKLFDRFYQVDSSQTREYEGSGIGLALTKELIELHSGTIKIQSELGKGSEFKITLPLGRKHLNDEEIFEPVETKEVERVIDDTSFTKKTELVEKDGSTISSDDKNIILVVEDNADVREYIKYSLGDGFTVEEAANGEQGFRKSEQIIPDLIISDIMMPKMDGNEFTRRIKNDEKTSHIPVILLTARSEQESRLEGLETGADDYLTKPFDTKELLVRIKNLITIRQNLQQKYSSGKITSKKDKPRLSSLDEKFLNNVFQVVEQHLSEEEFSIEQFGQEVGMGRVQLHRKLKALTGKSASLYLRTVRLSKAKEMIEDKKGNISEIAYSVGFSSPTYFTACFKKEFGYLPSDIHQ